MKLSRIGEDLNQILRALEIEGPAREAMAVAHWPGVVGEAIAAATRATGSQGGVLEVRTRSSAWTQELTFRKASLLKRLNARAGAQVFTDIRFKTGGVPDEAADAGGAARDAGEAAPHAEVAAIRVPEAAQRRIEAEARHADTELAALVRRALTHEWQLDEWRRRQGYRPCTHCGALCPPPRTTCPPCARDRVRK